MPSRLAFVATLPVFVAVATLTALASPARATVIFREDFEKGTLGRFASGSNTLPGRVVVVMKGVEVVDQGNYAVKVTMQGTERFNAQQLRVQLAPIYVDVVADGDTFMSLYIYAKDSPKTRDNFYYYEGSGSGNVMTWWLEPDATGGTVMKYGTGNLGARGLHWTGNFEIGKWHQLAAHMHWGNTDQTGNIQLWFDGALVLDKQVQTMVNPGRYFSEPGIHRDMTRTGASEVGVDSIYFDNIITADKLAEIELIPPPPGGADGGGASNDGAGPANVDAETSDAAAMPSGTGGESGTGSGGGSSPIGGGGAGGASTTGSGGRGAATGVSASGAGCSTTPGPSSGPIALGLVALLILWTRGRQIRRPGE
jgi:MYXO-CTERM domain-containing protein